MINNARITIIIIFIEVPIYYVHSRPMTDVRNESLYNSGLVKYNIIYTLIRYTRGVRCSYMGMRSMHDIFDFVFSTSCVLY